MDWTALILRDREAPTQELESQLWGGKACSLASLARHGVAVPRWLALSSELYKSAMARLEASSLIGPIAGVQRALFESGLDSEDWQALGAQVRAELGAGPFAVRSSASREDSAGASFAGQFASVLNVPFERLSAAICEVWASLHSDSVREYCRQQRIPFNELAMAVVIQDQVDAESAGVLFSVAPDDAEAIVVNSARGLGEGVVAERVPCDEDRIRRTDRSVLARRAGRAKTAVRLAASGGTELIDELGSDASVLTLEQLEELSRLALELEESFGFGLDIEWAYDRGGGLWIVQLRAMTGRGRLRIFDRTNVTESYPGQCSVLTFSCIRDFYAELFSRAGLALGVPRRLVSARRRMYESLVAYIDARVYYNLPSMYGLYTLVPGYEAGTEAWERMIGLSAARAERPAASLLTRLIYAPIVLWISLVAVLRLLTLGSAVRSLLERCERECQAVEASLEASEDADAVVEAHDRLMRNLVSRFEVTVINDFFLMLGFRLLHRGSRSLLGSEPEAQALANDLLAAQGVSSLEPLEALEALAADFRRCPEAEALFRREAASARRSSGEELYEALARASRGTDLSMRWAKHLRIYGHRRPGELELAKPSPELEPDFFVGALVAIWDGEASSKALKEGAEKRRRVGEERLRREASWFRRMALAPILAHCRRTLAWREALRLARARGFASLRRCFESLARSLARAGSIEHPGDIAFLGRDELIDEVLGRGLGQDLRGLVRLRREEQGRSRDLEAARRIVAWGPGGRARAAAWQAPASLNGGAEVDALFGQGCSAGRVRGRVKVVRDPTQAGEVRGMILVAAQTDPGWVFLLSRALALVAESGSLLSHTAIVGRELGIPTIVGVVGACGVMKDGEEWELDGSTGRLTRRGPIENENQSQQIL